MRNFFMSILLAVFIVIGGMALFAGWFFLSIPDPGKIKGCMVTQMYKVDLCPKNPNYAPLSSISKYAKDVIIISEDSSFYQHHGFDWFELKNSFRENWQDKQFSRGGSTITQQLVKNVFLTQEKSILRKLREAYITYHIEQQLDKKQILEKYLNVIEFGKGIYGIKRAARHYFGKSPSELNLLESAYLAYLLPNPKIYSQIYYKGALTQFSRHRILDLSYKMYRFGRIGQDQYLAAKDYVDHFPWKNLGPDQIAALQGEAPATGEEYTPFSDAVQVEPIQGEETGTATYELTPEEQRAMTGEELTPEEEVELENSQLDN